MILSSASCVYNLKGATIGRLRVIHRTENKSGRTRWTCECQCGKVEAIYASRLIYALKRKRSIACNGCLPKFTQRKMKYITTPTGFKVRQYE